MVNEKRGSVARAARVMQMGAGLAGSYFSYQLQRLFLNKEGSEKRKGAFHRKGAKRIREGLQDLRGPVMKLGQTLSMQSHSLAPEVIEELTALQREAPPMHPTLMRVQFKNALGKYPEEVFKSFEPKPAAAASLGQVHWAVTKDDEDVAVKIQYPAIREAIRNDFKLLRTAMLPARSSIPLYEAVTHEAERGILEEADYRKEAANIEYFQKHLKALSFVRIPQVRRSLSAAQVLCMTRLSGLHLDEYLGTKPSQAERDLLGERLLRMFFHQLLHAQALHADPHPGNYLFSEGGVIGLMDFGCVKYLKPEVVKGYQLFWRREWDTNPQIYDETINILWGKARSPSDPGVRRAMDEVKVCFDFFFPMNGRESVVDFGDKKLIRHLVDLAKALLNNKFVSPDFLFLSRAESGLYNLLHALGARVATTRIALEMFEAAGKGAA